MAAPPPSKCPVAHGNMPLPSSAASSSASSSTVPPPSPPSSSAPNEPPSTTSSSNVPPSSGVSSVAVSPVGVVRPARLSPSKCPVMHDKPAEGGSDGGGRTEPADEPDRPIASSHGIAIVRHSNSGDLGDIVPAGVIPATGRGNSESGEDWLNPTPNQLYRALKRKDKAISESDAFAVADVHEFVTSQTWSCIMEYEKLHEKECAHPKLARFSGEDGNYSPKARLVNFLGWASLPFDRHDWIVDRCGKEVRYVIDYYSSEDANGISYYVDARPALSFGGFVDRVHLAAKKWWAGQSVW